VAPAAKNFIAVCPKFDFSLTAVEDKVNLINIYKGFFQIFEDFLYDINYLNIIFWSCPSIKKSANRNPVGAGGGGAPQHRYILMMD
jgi:hypothetical protein